ncbi:MAG: hypothetical protein WBC04_26550 [Candidatus Acidiferrales bacterium]
MKKKGNSKAKKTKEQEDPRCPLCGDWLEDDHDPDVDGEACAYCRWKWSTVFDPDT